MVERRPVTPFKRDINIGQNEASNQSSVELRQGIARIQAPDSSERDSLDGSAWLGLNKYLSRHETFKNDSIPTQYVQSRLDRITDGRQAEVILVHADEPNGFATPGYVVVTDGLLKILGAEEELYGFLAHEWTHLSHGHIEEGAKRRTGFFARTGTLRGHETEADFAPLELLDRHGINPAGVKNMLGRLEIYNQVQREKQEENADDTRRTSKDLRPTWPPYSPTASHGDYEHGSLIDRRLNLEQAALFIDLRHISNSSTPIELDKSELDNYQKQADLWEHYEELDTLAKEHVIQRQALLLQKSEEPDQGTRNLLYARQKQLLKDVNPDISEHDTEYLAPLIAYGSNSAAVSDITLDMAHNFSLFDSDMLFKLGISITTRERENIASETLSSYLNRQEKISIEDFFRAISAETVKPYIQSSTYSGLVEALVDRDQFADSLQVLVDNLENSPMSGIDLNNVVYFAMLRRIARDEGYSGKIDQLISKARSDDAVSFARDLTSEERKLESKWQQSKECAVAREIQQELYRRRYEKALQMQDPIELAEFLSKHMDDLIEKPGKFDVLYQRLRHTPIEVVIDGLVRYAKEKNVDLSSQRFVRLFIEKPSYEASDNVYDEEGDDENKIQDEEMPLYMHSDERFLLWSLLTNKEGFLSLAGRDVRYFGYDSLDGIKKVASLILEAPARAQDLGVHIGWEIDRSDLGRLDNLTAQARWVLLSEVVKNKNPDIAVDLLGQFPLYGASSSAAISKRREVDDYLVSDDVRDSSEQNWDTFRKQMMENSTLGDADQKALIEFFALGCLSEDNQVLLQVPQGAMERIIEQATFDQGMDLVFDRFKHMPRHLFLRSLDVLIEQKARKIADFAMLESAVRDELGLFLSSNPERIGQAALVDAFLIDQYQTMLPWERRVGMKTETLKGMEPPKLLHALLSTSQDDAELKRYMLDRWWFRYRAFDPDLTRIFDMENILTYRGKTAQLENWVKEIPPQGRYKPLSQFVTDAYLASDGVKYALLRKILLGPEGIFSSTSGREDFQNTFLSAWVDMEGAGEGGKMTEELTHGMLASGSSEELYERINPILMDMILRLPQKYTTYKSFAEEEATKALAGIRFDKVPPPNVRDRDAIATKMHNLMLGGHEEKGLLDLSDAVSGLVMEFSSGKQQVEDRKMSPWDLAITIGEKSGAVGTRMLQMSGQYFDIPDQQRDRLMDSYDNVRGQSRLQAYRVLTREAEYSSQARQLLESISEIGPRIGGGSLMTVYDVTLKNGTHEAIAVKNPNAEYHVENAVDFASRTVGSARDDNPEDRNYQLLDVLLSDVKQWVTDELTDPNFETKDILFRQQNDYRNRKFDNGNSSYSMLVPQSIPTGTRWIRREEFIDGKNFTGLEVTDDATDIKAGKINRNDHKQAVATLIRNYMYQMLDTGLVHSDVHPGNFRITADNKHIAVFDRYNLLELDKADKQLLEGFIGAFRRGGAEAASERVLEYALNLEDNLSFAPQKKAILEEIRERSTQQDVERGILDSIVYLKQKGIKIPLKISLVGKNLLALNRMAQEAGFGSLAEAYRHTARTTDLLKFALMR